MKRTSNPPMKKHQACHWLNIIIEDQKRMLEHRLESVQERDGKVRDRESGELRDMTEAEKANYAEYDRREIAEYESKITALDIAACSLTKQGT
jgi:hypothetical protein